MSDRVFLRNVVVTVAVAGYLGACRPTRVSLAVPSSQLGPIPKIVPSAPPIQDLPIGASLRSYVAYALAHSPVARAAFERWRAAQLRVTGAGLLPDPKVSFGYYLRSVETKVGPQRFYVDLSQTMPWPGTLRAGENAAAERANALAQVFDSQALAIARDVADAYWSLWIIQQEHKLRSEHDAVLESLNGTVRGRMQIGSATLSDLSQVELNTARHHDHRSQSMQAALQASAKLSATLGAPPSEEVLPIRDTPIAGLPTLSLAELRALGARHPMLEQFSRLAASEDQMQQVERKRQYPSFSLGFRWIETGGGGSAVDSGDDAVILSGGLSVPLWAATTSDGIQATQAAARGHRADREVALRQSEANITRAFHQIQDADRRIKLYERTLIPQARTTLQAVLGSYQVGRTTVASVILAQRDVIDLQLEHVRIQASHARSWAQLEFFTGTQVGSTGGRDD